MLKIKYLHRGARSYEDDWETEKYFRIKNINLFSDLPKRQSFRNGSHYNIDWRPLLEFIESKIGENWNDVYSEILKKVKKKFRYQYNWCLPIKPIYDEKFIPRDKNGRILINVIFLDINNIICKKTEDEILIDSIKFIRKQKLEKILEKRNENNGDENGYIEGVSEG